MLAAVARREDLPTYAQAICPKHSSAQRLLGSQLAMVLLLLPLIVAGCSGSGTGFLCDDCARSRSASSASCCANVAVVGLLVFAAT